MNLHNREADKGEKVRAEDTHAIKTLCWSGSAQPVNSIFASSLQEVKIVSVALIPDIVIREFHGKNNPFFHVDVTNTHTDYHTLGY